MIKTKYYSFEEIKDLEYSSENSGKWATQLMRMYRLSREINEPTILELGVQKGTSTTVLLQACEEKGGNLTSVDIRDCSDVSNDNKWKFIKSDSTNYDYIVGNSPILKDGIDILYVDTIHNVDHVEKEVDKWFPLLNKGAWAFFDDVDAHGYRPGQKKSNRMSEFAIDDLHNFVMNFYHSNEDQYYLDICYGSTGMACLRKISPIGTVPNKVHMVKKRKR